ncbi:MAG: phosphoenolpyruvate--protein phosphotransferase [Zoogloeaceae bacterium]|mgnify:CR=1 FL=1|nr:phosphoenolpyruvate--protein phosphotransferase [Zoogloeaceae bacterium]
MAFTVHGLPVSQGIAIGHAHLVSRALLEVNHYHVAEKHVGDEMKRLDDSVAAVKKELNALKATAASSQAHGEVGAFVDLQLIMLADPLLVDAARTVIQERRCNAEWAMVQQMDHLVAQFEQIEDAYLRERKADVVQVVERVVKDLVGHPGHLPPKRRDGLGTIIVAHDLSPADTIGFRDHNIAGFLTDIGGPTSHTAIVARTLSIPAVVGLHRIRDLVEENELIIIDGTLGIVIVDPDEAIVEEYRLRRTELELKRSRLKLLRDTPANTLDGRFISLLGNIEGPGDVAQIKSVNADGVGLYRTEFLFMGREDLPGEDEQFEAYRAVVKQLADKPVTIRTFDVGADKMLSIGAQREEPNPALGLRAVRFSLAEPQMFRTQLRALLRASAYGQLRIMIPMISHVQELEQALAMLALAREELKAGKQKFDEGLQVGAMIEVPAAALAIGMFRKRVSFLSLGTNDLIQYTLAIDRTDDAVVHLYDPLHPAVLKLIAGTIQAGTRYGMSVSVCGEMAGDLNYTRLLLGMGLREFSMHPANVLEIKQQLLHADYSELAPRVQRILRMDEPARVHEAVLKLAG